MRISCVTAVMGVLAAFASPHWAAAQSADSQARVGGAVIGTGAVTR